MKRTDFPSRVRRLDFERADEAKTEEIFIKGSCFLRVPAPVGVMMQTLDHVTSIRLLGLNYHQIGLPRLGKLADSGFGYDGLPA